MLLPNPSGDSGMVDDGPGNFLGGSREFESHGNSRESGETSGGLHTHINLAGREPLDKFGGRSCSLSTETELTADLLAEVFSYPPPPTSHLPRIQLFEVM